PAAPPVGRELSSAPVSAGYGADQQLTIAAACRRSKKAPGLPGLARRGSRKRPDPPGEATGRGLGTTRWSLGRAPSASLPERVIPQRRLAAISQGQLGKPGGQNAEISSSTGSKGRRSATHSRPKLRRGPSNIQNSSRDKSPRNPDLRLLR